MFATIFWRAVLQPSHEATARQAVTAKGRAALTEQRPPPSVAASGRIVPYAVCILNEDSAENPDAGLATDLEGAW